MRCGCCVVYGSKVRLDFAPQRAGGEPGGRKSRYSHEIPPRTGSFASLIVLGARA
jgi:hypothetical protein